jgi:DNA-binding response OmpR family regulator
MSGRAEAARAVGEETMRPGTRVLVVEDDRYIRELMAMELEHRGLEVLCVPDGPSGLEAAGRFRPDIVVLDVMLPGLDGVGVLKRLRTSGSRVPVVMLTARDAPTDKIHSLDLGADDYLTKPFHVEELLARMRAVLRRTEGEEVLRVGDLTIDRASMEVRRGERRIKLTAREYRLLEFMALNARRVLSREVLLSRVWKDDPGVTSNAVEVYVGYLRKKLDAPGEPRLIHTVRGVGYVLREG